MSSKYEDYIAYLDDRGVKESVMHRILRPKHCEFICELAKDRSFSNILEIGRSKGHSLGLFKYLFPGSMITSVDIVRHSEADVIVDIFNNDKSITLIDGDITNLKTDSIFDLILIDGDHTYQGCKKDWDNIQQYIEPGSVVLIDDLNHPHGCGKVFYENINHYNHEIIMNEESVEGLGVIYI